MYQALLNSKNAAVSTQAAVITAARTVLLKLYDTESLQIVIDDVCDDLLGNIPKSNEKIRGEKIGVQAGDAILALRDSQNERTAVQNSDGQLPNTGQFNGNAAGLTWGTNVAPFVVSRDVLDLCTNVARNKFPAFNTPAYAAAFNEVKALGGTVNTVRNQEQLNVGLFWAYDGRPGLGTPPRLYNQIALQLVQERHLQNDDLLKLLLAVNVAMADASIVCWRAKYTHLLWRPSAGVRGADSNPANPTGNAATIPDATRIECTSERAGRQLHAVFSGFSFGTCDIWWCAIRDSRNQSMQYCCMCGLSCDLL